MVEVHNLIKSILERNTLRRTRRPFKNDTPLELPKRFDMVEAGSHFVEAFNLAASSSPALLITELDKFPVEFAGYACEGAALSIGLAAGQSNSWDLLLDFLQATPAHRYNTASGVGGFFSHAQLAIDSIPLDIDPYWRWLLLDGYAFHQAFFNAKDVIIDQKRPSGLRPEEERTYNQGIGRAIWHGCEGNPGKIRDFVNQFAAERRSDMWHGVGLQASYCGGVERDYQQLKKYAGEHLDGLVTGTALGVVSRATSGYMPSHSRYAASTICGADAPELVNLFERIAREVRESDDSPEMFLAIRKKVSDAVLD